MISEKVMHFQGKNRDLNQLSQQIVQQLSSEGYKTQSSTAPFGTVILAGKTGILRDIMSADRAFSILITGQPDDFLVRVGIGKWKQNLAVNRLERERRMEVEEDVAGVETILLSWLWLAVEVPEDWWAEHIENGIAKEITEIIG